MSDDVLKRELATLDADTRRRLDGAGFDEARFVALAATLREGDAATRRRTRNTVRGTVTPPGAEEIGRLPSSMSSEGKALIARGEEVLVAGELAFCTMAGGMATRMGGIVKALAEVFDGHTFLGMRLEENRRASERAKRPVPMWLMTSEATDAAITADLQRRGAPDHVRGFMQDLSLRLKPDGTLFRDGAGHPSLHATGHGDLPDALRRSGLLDRFLGRGGKYVWITNVDNLGASIDPMLLGHFLASGKDVLCEVCRKEGDRGGIPVHAEGRLQVLEEFRLPSDFDADRVQVFNTNTFLVRAEALAKAPLTWTFFEVEKKVDGAPAIQFERLLQEITAQLPTAYVEVPRDGENARFLPVKDTDELARRRKDIELVARARGMV